MPGLPSVAASSQGWASVGSMWSTSLNEDWLPEWTIGSTGGFTVPCSPSSSGYIFTSTGDGTTGTGNAYYALGRAVRVVQGVSTIYGPIASASVAAGVTTVGLSSSLATAALSTATAFTSVAVGTESGHSLAGSSGLGATKFHREDGTWAAPGTVEHGASDHTDRTRDLFIPAAAWGSGSAAGTLGQQTTANQMEIACWKLDDTTDEHVVTSFLVPADWASGALTYKIYWAMDTATTGNVVLSINALARASGEVADPGGGPDFTQADTIAVPGTAETLTVSTLSVTHTVAAGDLVLIHLKRNASSGSDTATGDLLFIGLEVEYQADQ